MIAFRLPPSKKRYTCAALIRLVGKLLPTYCSKRPSTERYFATVEGLRCHRRVSGCVDEHGALRRGRQRVDLSLYDVSSWSVRRGLPACDSPRTQKPEPRSMAKFGLLREVTGGFEPPYRVLQTLA